MGARGVRYADTSAAQTDVFGRKGGPSVEPRPVAGRGLSPPPPVGVLEEGEGDRGCRGPRLGRRPTGEVTDEVRRTGVKPGLGQWRRS